MQQRDRGLTVLEISLSVFLLFAIGASVVSIHRKKASEAEIQQCVEKQWSWTPTLELLEANIRKWEMLAGPCLKAGFLPVEHPGDQVSPTIWEIDSVRPLMRAMTSPTALPVPIGHDFIAGQSVILCSNQHISFGSIKQVYVGTGNQSMVEVEYEGPAPTELFPVGSLVVALKPVVYESELSANPPERILFAKKSAQDRAPMVVGFDHFNIELTSDEDKTSQIKIVFSFDTCALKDNFPLIPHSIEEDYGRWWLRESSLILEPWPISMEGTP